MTDRNTGRRGQPTGKSPGSQGQGSEHLQPAVGSNLEAEHTEGFGADDDRDGTRAGMTADDVATVSSSCTFRTTDERY